MERVVNITTMPFPFQPRFVILEERGHLMIVTFNRPKAMNSMPAAMHCELSKIFRLLDIDTNELIDLKKEDVDKIKIRKNLPGKKIQSIEVLVKVENNN